MSTELSTCHCDSHGAAMAPEDAPVIALVGAPNAGKSTLFNALTGAHARMGNWPGTTVEVSRGVWRTDKGVYDLIDFPGAYSLDPISPDEELTRQLVIAPPIEDRPHAVIIAVDATTLSRSLYMVAQLAEEEFRLLIVLTKGDVASNYGINIDVPALSKALDIPIVAVDPRRRHNVKEVSDALAEVLSRPARRVRVGKYDCCSRSPEYVEDREDAEATVGNTVLGNAKWSTENTHDSNAESEMRDFLIAEDRFEWIEEAISSSAEAGSGVGAKASSGVSFGKNTLDDPGAENRGDTGSDSRVNHAMRASNRGQQRRRTGTERIDRWVLHPWIGPLIFLATMWFVFQITTTVAAPLQDGLDTFFSGPVSDAATAALERIGQWFGIGSMGIATGLIVNGFIGGVGMVLTFAPLMALMFLCLAVLEDSGYMARAAVITDKLMKSIGLPGKAFIPLIVGFGCNVPAIAATRVLARPQQRVMTALLIPFTSCSARLTVYVMLAATFFPDHAGTVVFAMYVISIALVVLMGLVMKNLLWQRVGREALVIDLPVYQIPTPRLALSVMWMRLKGFLQTAGGIIVVTVMVVFVLQSTPTQAGYGFADEELPTEDSVYGVVAEKATPIFEPAGFGSWSIVGTLLTGFVAKEAVISSWAQTYALEDPSDESPEEQGNSAVAQAIREDFSQASSGHTLAAVWAFMIFLLSYTPCVATLAAQRREVGMRWTLIGVFMQLALAWTLAVVVFNVLKIWL